MDTGRLIRAFSAVITAGIALAHTWTLAQAQAASVPTSQAPVSLQPSVATAPELNRADVEAWLDGFLPYAFDQADIAGGVVVVVKDGQILLQKGYGYADVEHGTPVDPERTLFRPGSVGKLFTWTAVMQLVEQGKLDLDRDINGYLDFTISPRFGKPITMRHLMTHTPGFEERYRGLLGFDPQALVPLETYVKTLQPSRIFAPGEVFAYSNYGVTLAGYIVQRLSGESFDDYIDRHIFMPLGMHHATFRQPLPERLAADMSKGYKLASGAAQPYELFGVAPAGSAAVAGADMARFMIAHLRAEAGEATNMLGPDAARLMHRTAFQAIPPLNGIALGFFDFSRNGRRILRHGGKTPAFQSDLILLMDEGVGVFTSINSDGEDGAGDSFSAAFFEQFVDRYFPAALAPEPATATALEHARLVAQSGPYRNSRRAASSFFALESLLSQQDVEVNEDGTIVTPFVRGVNDKPKVWREVGPFVWRDVAGKERLAARVVEGKVVALGGEIAGGYLLKQPVPPALSAVWNKPLLLGSASVLLLTLVFWPVTTLARRHFGATTVMSEREARAHQWVRAVALVDLIFLLGYFALFQSTESSWALFEGRLDLAIRLLQLLGLLGIAGAGVALWNARLTWIGNRGWWTKGWSVVLAVACVAIVWIAFAFNLITGGLSY
jgi:CubicO group peptidase (beta-lactamase class C family)